MAEIEMPKVDTDEILGSVAPPNKKPLTLSAKPEKKKQNFLSRAMMGLKSDDGKNVASYIFEDAILPGFQDLVYNTVDTIVETAKSVARTAIYGENTPKSSKKQGEFIDYVDFWEANNKKSSKRSGYANVFSIEVFKYRTLDDAQSVLYRMQDVLDEYGKVLVADYYEFSGYDAPHTYNGLGWTSLGRARTRQARGGGYYIELPRPKQIDNL